MGSIDLNAVCICGKELDINNIVYGRYDVTVEVEICPDCSEGEESLEAKYDEGYKNGQQDGYNDGYLEGKEDSYDEGYEKGYKQGHEDGLRDARETDE